MVSNESSSETEENDEWVCPHCGSGEPHDAITFPKDDDWQDEVEVDVTCQSVYITSVDGGVGFAFDHSEFAEIVTHFQESDHVRNRVSEGNNGE